MLIATGLMITWVLIVLVGQTVQVMQKVGWIPLTPIDGFHPPYWSGVWVGVYPTWEGIVAQFAAATFVIGSYFAAEGLRRHKRARILAAPISGAPPAAEGLEATPAEPAAERELVRA
jgi:high-affinity iron transporter